MQLMKKYGKYIVSGNHDPFKYNGYNNALDITFLQTFDAWTWCIPRSRVRERMFLWWVFCALGPRLGLFVFHALGPRLGLFVFHALRSFPWDIPCTHFCFVCCVNVDFIKWLDHEVVSISFLFDKTDFFTVKVDFIIWGLHNVGILVKFTSEVHTIRFYTQNRVLSKIFYNLIPKL